MPRTLGIGEEDIAQAIKTARKVKQAPARHIVEVANELLDTTAVIDAGTKTASAAPASADSKECC